MFKFFLRSLFFFFFSRDTVNPRLHDRRNETTYEGTYASKEGRSGRSGEDARFELISFKIMIYIDEEEMRVTCTLRHK